MLEDLRNGTLVAIPMRLISSGKMASLSTAFVVLAALFWGLSGGIGGILMANGWNALVVSFYRGAIGLLFVLVWLVLRPHGSGLVPGPTCFPRQSP